MDSWEELAKAMGIQDTNAFTIGVVVVAFLTAVGTVLKLVNDNRAVWSSREREQRSMDSIKMMEGLDKYQRDEILTREMLRREHELDVEYSRGQFKTYVKMMHLDKSSTFRRRGAAQLLYWFVCSALIASGAFLSLLISMMAVRGRIPNERLTFVVFSIGIAAVLAGIALLFVVDRCWRASLVGYAYEKHIWPCLERRLKRILTTTPEDQRESAKADNKDNVDNKGALEELETKMNSLGKAQTKLPLWSGLLLGSFFPIGFVSVAFRVSGHTAIVKGLLGVDQAVSLIGIFLSLIVLWKSTKIPPTLECETSDSSAASPSTPTTTRPAGASAIADRRHVRVSCAGPDRGGHGRVPIALEVRVVVDDGVLDEAFDGQGHGPVQGCGGVAAG